MRANSPAKSDYSLSKFPPNKIRNMNKEEYGNQRNVVSDINVYPNSTDRPDAEVGKTRRPEVNLKQSNIISQKVIQTGNNFESLYQNEVQSKQQLQSQYETL